MHSALVEKAIYLGKNQKQPGSICSLPKVPGTVADTMERRRKDGGWSRGQDMLSWVELVKVAVVLHTKSSGTRLQIPA